MMAYFSYVKLTLMDYLADGGAWGQEKKKSDSGHKNQGEGQGGCKSKCLHPEVERGEVRVCSRRSG